MTQLFYKGLYFGLLVCGGFVSLIMSIVVWRKMIVEGQTFSQLGADANAIIFMGVLALISFVIAWRLKAALNKLIGQ